MKKEIVMKALDEMNADDVRAKLYNHLWEETKQDESADLLASILDKLNESGTDLTDWNLFDRLCYIAAAASINGFMNGYEMGIKAAKSVINDVIV